MDISVGCKGDVNEITVLYRQKIPPPPAIFPVCAYLQKPFSSGAEKHRVYQGVKMKAAGRRFLLFPGYLDDWKTGFYVPGLDGGKL
jgi:hypothetical protein